MQNKFVQSNDSKFEPKFKLQLYKLAETEPAYTHPHHYGGTFRRVVFFGLVIAYFDNFSPVLTAVRNEGMMRAINASTASHQVEIRVNALNRKRKYLATFFSWLPVV